MLAARLISGYYVKHKSRKKTRHAPFCLYKYIIIKAGTDSYTSKITKDMFRKFRL